MASRPSRASTSSLIAERSRSEQAGDLVVGPAQAGDGVDDAEDGPGQTVAGGVEVGEGVGLGALAGRDLDERRRQQLGVAERLGQAVPADGVGPHAGAADERPTGSPRSAQEPGPTAAAAHVGRAPAGRQPPRQGR